MVKAIEGMRVALGQLPRLSDQSLAFARQLGVTGIQLNTPDLPGEFRWEVADLHRVRETCDAAGLRLEAIENLPNHFYEHCMIGGPRRDDQYRTRLRHDSPYWRSGHSNLGLQLHAGVSLAHLDAARRPRGRTR